MTMHGLPFDRGNEVMAVQPPPRPHCGSRACHGHGPVVKYPAAGLHERRRWGFTLVFLRGGVSIHLTDASIFLQPSRMWNHESFLVPARAHLLASSPRNLSAAANIQVACRHHGSTVTHREMYLRSPAFKAGSLRQYGTIAPLPHIGRSTQNSSCRAQHGVWGTTRSSIAGNEVYTRFARPAVQNLQYNIAGAGHACCATAALDADVLTLLVAAPKGCLLCKFVHSSALQELCISRLCQLHGGPHTHVHAPTLLGIQLEVPGRTVCSNSKPINPRQLLLQAWLAIVGWMQAASASSRPCVMCPLLAIGSRQPAGVLVMQGKLGYFAGNFYLNVNQLRQVAKAQPIVCKKYSNDKLKRLPLPQSCTIVLFWDC